GEPRGGDRGGDQRGPAGHRLLRAEGLGAARQAGGPAERAQRVEGGGGERDGLRGGGAGVQRRIGEHGRAAERDAELAGAAAVGAGPDEGVARGEAAGVHPAEEGGRVVEQLLQLHLLGGAERAAVGAEVVAARPARPEGGEAAQRGVVGPGRVRAVHGPRADGGGLGPRRRAAGAGGQQGRHQREAGQGAGQAGSRA
ncbi:MAG: hypothetical protein ACK559_05750, partial [bacterium]